MVAITEIRHRGSTRPEGSRHYKRYVLFILAVAYTSNFVDRQILSILLEPIKKELLLSDTQLGVLSGVAFALFYATLGIPIARLADRTNRVNIIAIATALWSLMTALCGMAVNFTQLLMARIGVGIGEAGLSPPAHSIISDYFSAKERPGALAVYSLGVPIGTLIGYLVGGWVNEIWGWRVAFMAVGLPGLLIAIILKLTLREPVRGAADSGTDISKQTVTMAEVFSYLWQSRSFRHLSMGTALLAFVAYGGGAWVPVFLIRMHSMTTGEVGTWLAILVGVFATLGTMLGGYLGNRLGKTDERWYMWIPGLAVLCVVPFSISALLAETKFMVILLLIIPTMLPAAHTGPVFSTVQSLVSAPMRAVAAAILLFIVNLIGMGLGPLVTGLLSDALIPMAGAESLRYAMLLLTFVNLWAAFHYYMASRTIRQDLARVAS